MQNKVRFLGMDVHAETISVAIAEADGEVRSFGTMRMHCACRRRRTTPAWPVSMAAMIRMSCFPPCRI
jgi:hypothetical protein